MTVEPQVLITGGGGQLSKDLAQVFDTSETLVLSRGELDISRAEAVDLAMLHYRPDVIINAAAWTDVDGCESNEKKARLINSEGPRNLVAAAQKCGARVVQISTDYVFDGVLDRPYLECDQTNPQSIYGQTKLEGELAMRKQDLIVRTSWLCGLHGSNILKTIVGLAASESPMVFVDDQIGHPSFTCDVAVTIQELVSLQAHGIFHVTNQGAVSWFEFAQTILEHMGHPITQVSPIATSQLDPPRPAQRPANSVLENAELHRAGLDPPPDFRESLPELLEALCA